MAIEAKNRRKRKHQATQPDGMVATDDGEVAVPKKVAKKMKKAKENEKQKHNKKSDSAVEEQQLQVAAEVENGANDDAEEQEGDDLGSAQQTDTMQEHDSGFEEKALKFSKDFKMLHFRTKLRSNNFITELRHFLHVVQSRPNLVAKYIEKRGKPLELAEALERIDKTNLLHIGYLCQALQLVLMEIVSNQKDHTESAVYASRYFLKSHGTVVDLLLKSAQLQHRRTALKLLTAFVCVDPQLGRQLLASFDALFNVKTIENLLSQSHLELGEPETVRKCFIHFVLAYLVDGNTLLIRNILDRGALIRALVSGLQYDDHVTVCVVVNTLRKYVLECAEISKTKKINVFDVECCRNFAHLYDWLGPKVYATKCSGKQGARTQLRPEEIEGLVNAEERDAVAKVVHEFMLLLLTSRKHGICFDAVTHYRQKHNAIQGKLVSQLYKPWCDKRKTELVIRVLTACPDLGRHTVRHFAGIINPMRTPSRDWIGACTFLTKIITTLQPQLLHAALDKITLTDCTYFVKDVCLPIEALALVSGAKMLRHENFQFRLAANRLLYTMFSQYSAYMSAITKRVEARGNLNSLRRFRLDILNHILVNFPTVEDILFSLYMSIKSQGDEVNVLEHLDVSLDLVLVICKEHRSFVNKTSTILDYLELLRPLYAGDEEKDFAAETSNIKLELKAIKTILLLLPKALEPNENLFSSVLKSFIKAFVYGSGEVSIEAGELLRKIFLNTGLFDSGVWEVDLWLETLRLFDAATVDVVTQVFTEVLQVTKVDVEIPKTAESKLSEQNLQKLFENIENGLSVQAYVESISISKLMPLIFKGVEIISPLNKYLETVCLLLYHYYPNPEQVLQLYKQKFKALEKYMAGWLVGGKELSLTTTKLPLELTTLAQVHEALLHGDVRLAKIFAAPKAEDRPLELKLRGETVVLSAALRSKRLLMIYVQQALFAVAQLVEKQQLTAKQAEAAANFIGDCIEVVNEQVTYEQTVSAKDEQDYNFLDDLFKYIFNLRLTRIQSTALFSANSDSQLSYLYFLRLLTERCNAHAYFETHAVNCRLKVVKAIAISIQEVEHTKAASEQLADAVRLVRALQLRTSECTEVVELLVTQLKYNDFVLEDAMQKSIYYEFLVCALQRLGALRRAVQCDSFMRKLAKLYVNLVKRFGNEMGFEQLEEALHDFLCITHQYIPQLGTKFFSAFFAERRIAKSTIKLACLLLERDAQLGTEFEQLLPENLNKKELVYPLLDIAFRKRLTLEPALLQNVYQSFKSGFMKTIEKPQKAGVIYKEHAGASIALIEHCMPRSESVDFCNKSFKFDGLEVYQLRVIHAIYKKAISSAGEATASSAQRASIFVNFINLLVQLLSLEMKKQLLDADKLELSAFLLYDWWQLAKAQRTTAPLVELKKRAAKNKKNANAADADDENDIVSADTTTDDIHFAPDFSKLLKNQQWLNFCKLCLKLGMQSVDGDDTAPQQSDATNALLLQLLAYLCQQLYADYSADEDAEPPLAEPAQLFDMICTHSKFFDIVLSPREIQVKTQVLHLLYTLALKNPEALSDAQIPIILGAYQAKLSDADRYALALLQLYERHDCNLQQYRPFIWGESAIAFYSLRAAVEERAKLTQQETSIAHVMGLIDRQLCEYTIDNFPIWRKLNGEQQLPTVEFRDPTMKALEFGTNELERRIELGCEHFEVAELRLCPVRAHVYTQCYDPAFFVPLMSLCFSPQAYPHPAHPVQNGLLAMVFAALSSQDRDMRLAASCVQLRYRAHFEANKFFERPLWVQAYDNIQAGLSELRDSWVKHKKNSGTPRVPYISGLFVAKTFNLTTDPTHLLYKQLTMYLRLKSTFNFQCVPEFNVLFYSPEIEHQAFRQFIVEVIRNGIKSGSDLFLLITTNTFKVLQGFYGSAMSTLEMNLLILSVFSICAKIPASSKVMIEHVGLLPWLNSVISTIEFYHFDVIEGLISTLSNLWYSVRAFASEFHNFAHITLELHQLVLRLLPYLSARISPHNFARLMNVLQKTACGQHRAMSESQLANLIECAGKHYGTLVHDIEGISAFGGAGAAAHEEYCRGLHAAGGAVDASTIMALSSLRAYTIDWWHSRHAQKVVAGGGADVTVSE